MAKLSNDDYASLPNKTMARIDGSFHFIMLDQPDKFTPTVNLLSPQWRANFNNAFDKLSGDALPSSVKVDYSPATKELLASQQQLQQAQTGAKPTSQAIPAKLTPEQINSINFVVFN